MKDMSALGEQERRQELAAARSALVSSIASAHHREKCDLDCGDRAWGDTADKEFAEQAVSSVWYLMEMADVAAERRGREAAARDIEEFRIDRLIIHNHFTDQALLAAARVAQGDGQDG